MASDTISRPGWIAPLHKHPLAVRQARPFLIINENDGRLPTKWHDYLPFGEEVYANQGLRTTGLGYTGDPIRQKFTAYERDSETGLDYTQARYFSSGQGRFTSPDPLMASAKATDPQSWNRYAYVGNNPMTFSDPSGLIKHSSMCPGCGGIQQGSHLGGTDEWFMGTDIGGEVTVTTSGTGASSNHTEGQPESGTPNHETQRRILFQTSTHPIIVTPLLTRFVTLLIAPMSILLAVRDRT